MDVYIIESKIQFKAPQPGQQTRPCAEHYEGRRVFAEVDGVERLFRFTKEELAFDATEGEIEQAILQKLDGAR